MRKLTRVELKRVELTLIKRQGGKCPLCEQRFGARGGPVVDHCHTTGAVRAILCRTCNGGEGKIKNGAVRYGRGLDNYIQWLSNLVDYLKHHSENPSSLMYPSHKTEDDKRLARNKKARQSRAKSKGK